MNAWGDEYLAVCVGGGKLAREMATGKLEQFLKQFLLRLQSWDGAYMATWDEAYMAAMLH